MLPDLFNRANIVLTLNIRALLKCKRKSKHRQILKINYRKLSKQSIVMQQIDLDLPDLFPLGLISKFYFYFDIIILCVFLCKLFLLFLEQERKFIIAK